MTYQSRTKRLLSSPDSFGGKIEKSNEQHYTLIPDTELIALIERANRPQPVQTASVHTWVAYASLLLLGVSGVGCAVWGYLHPQVIERPVIVKDPEKVNSNCLFFCK